MFWLVRVAVFFEIINAVESSADCITALSEFARLKSTAAPTRARIGISASAKVMATLPLRAAAMQRAARRRRRTRIWEADIMALQQRLSSIALYAAALNARLVEQSKSSDHCITSLRNQTCLLY